MVQHEEEGVMTTGSENAPSVKRAQSAAGAKNGKGAKSAESTTNAKSAKSAAGGKRGACQCVCWSQVARAPER